MTTTWMSTTPPGTEVDDAPASDVAARAADEAPATMSVDTVEFDATRAFVRVVGDLDLATAPPLWAVLRGHIRAGRRYLRLDMSGVTFLDATALTGITAAHQDLLATRGTLVVTGVSSLVARVLRLTGLSEVLFVSGLRPDDDRAELS